MGVKPAATGWKNNRGKRRGKRYISGAAETLPRLIRPRRGQCVGSKTQERLYAAMVESAEQSIAM
jgi:hypothetical protein